MKSSSRQHGQPNHRCGFNNAKSRALRPPPVAAARLVRRIKCLELESFGPEQRTDDGSKSIPTVTHRQHVQSVHGATFSPSRSNALSSRLSGERAFEFIRNNQDVESHARAKSGGGEQKSIHEKNVSDSPGVTAPERQHNLYPRQRGNLWQVDDALLL